MHLQFSKRRHKERCWRKAETFFFKATCVILEKKRCNLGEELQTRQPQRFISADVSFTSRLPRESRPGEQQPHVVTTWQPRREEVVGTQGLHERLTTTQRPSTGHWTQVKDPFQLPARNNPFWSRWRNNCPAWEASWPRCCPFCACRMKNEYRQTSSLSKSSEFGSLISE